ncbi:hypothetical protein SL034_004261 [Vibrio harveyi]|uniref:hypothetical protein n=1 Tax=Vibrio harveyi group TaxID=717610 RepID=UPI0010FE1556|nr:MULTISPECIES: hypothetical protein [Vibrio harveyi group]ELY1989173.1 hypothetical protein [Vibrio harveyi]WHP52912.1 hypothetical protein QMY43_25180 [Vibrio parahaemolyticus]
MRVFIFNVLKRIGLLPSTVVDSSELEHLNNMSSVMDEYREIVDTIGTRTELLDIPWFRSSVVSVGEKLNELDLIRNSSLSNPTDYSDLIE